MTDDGWWRQCYRDALLELRPEELRQRIAAAEKAIQQRILGLRQSDSRSEEERRDLLDAVRVLRILASTECKASASTPSGLAGNRVTS